MSTSPLIPAALRFSIDRFVTCIVNARMASGIPRMGLSTTSIVASGALRGAGDSKGPFFISLATMWGVRITLSFLLAGSLGLNGVWLAMAAELCVRGLIFMVRLYRGRWLNIDLFQTKKS